MTLNTAENVAAAQPAAEPKAAPAEPVVEVAPVAPAVSVEEEKDDVAERVRAVVEGRVEKDKERQEERDEPKEKPAEEAEPKETPAPKVEEEPKASEANDLPPELLARAEKSGLKADDLLKVSPGIRKFFVSQFEKVIAQEKAEAERTTEASTPESIKPDPATEFKPVEIAMDGYEEDTKAVVTPLLEALNETRKELHDFKTERQKEVAQRAEQGQRVYEEQVLGFFNHSIASLPSEELAFFGEKPQKGTDEYKSREEMWDVFADLLDLNETAAKPRTVQQIFESARAQYLYPKAKEAAVKQIQNKVKSRSRTIADPPSTRKGVPSEKPPTYVEVRDQEAKKIASIFA